MKYYSIYNCNQNFTQDIWSFDDVINAQKFCAKYCAHKWEILKDDEETINKIKDKKIEIGFFNIIFCCEKDFIKAVKTIIKNKKCCGYDFYGVIENIDEDE